MNHQVRRGGQAGFPCQWCRPPLTRKTRVVGCAPRRIEERVFADLDADGDFEWTSQYEAQEIDAMSTSSVVLPVMPLKKVKVVTDTVQLQIFEPRFRLMFRLIKKSKSRIFGVALRTKDGLCNVGVLCELTHFVPVPSRKSIFVSSRAIGRFKIDRVHHSKPFLAVEGSGFRDYESEGALEADVWARMASVKDLVNSVATTSLDDDAFSLEVRRWSKDEKVRNTVRGSISSHPGMLDECRRLGLMGEARPSPVASVSKDALFSENEAVEFICSESRESDEERMIMRAEKFSFALARSMEMGDDKLQAMLHLLDTDERLKMAQGSIEDSYRYLVARKSLKDL
jgi:Lon protease-like protein